MVSALSYQILRCVVGLPTVHCNILLSDLCEMVSMIEKKAAHDADCKTEILNRGRIRINVGHT